MYTLYDIFFMIREGRANLVENILNNLQCILSLLQLKEDVDSTSTIASKS